jgi:hypothetical protein
MDEHTQLWNEYESLRNEIKDADSLNYQVLGIMVAAVAVLITTGIKTNGCWLESLLIILCVYVVTIPAYAIMKGNRRRIWRISTYLRVFIEPNLFAKWETRLDIQRDKEKNDKKKQTALSSLVSFNEYRIVILMNWSAALFAIIETMIRESMNHQVYYGIPILVILFNLIFTIWAYIEEKKLKRLGKVEKNFIKSWESVKHSTSNKNNDPDQNPPKSKQ